MCIRILFASVEDILVVKIKFIDACSLFLLFANNRCIDFNYYISFSPSLRIAFGYCTAIVINEFISVTYS